jgi:uncharacterized protein
MAVIGTVESLWRYPVKSMRGEELDEMFAGYAGVYGDRLFAFTTSASPKGFPYFTGREQRHMLRYWPRFRSPDTAARPINQSEAKTLSPLLNPVSASPAELMLDVEAPDGKTFAIDDPALIEALRAGLEKDKHQLTLLRSDRAMTDCLPVSIFAVQTAKKLGEETGVTIDKRRFRANVYVDLTDAEGFAEDQFVGKSLRLGEVVVSILARDTRCAMITLDPDTSEKNPAILKQVAQAHEAKAGVYGAVLTEGMIRKGDVVELL